MFSTNIVTVNNFYKRLASVFIAIALMMTSMLVACGKKEDIVHSQECNVIVEIGSSGYSLGDYEDQNLVTYTFSEEELGSNEEIRQCLKQFINDNANADVVVAEYFFNGKYEDTSYELRGFYATNDKCYSYYITVSAGDSLTEELYERLKEECKKKENNFEYVVLRTDEELQHGSEVQIGTVEWCESHIMTNKDMESKIISYVKKWTQVDDIENIIVGSFHLPYDESYSIFAKVDGKWYEGYKWEGYTKMPLTDEEYVEIGTFTSNCWNEYYNSDFYKKEMEEY